MAHRNISFTFVITYILGAILKSKKSILLTSIVLDTLNALTRIGAVLALSLFATSIQSNDTVTILSYSISLPPTLIGKSLLAAGSVAGLFALSAVFNYLSIILARRMARSLNEDILADVIAGLSVAPELAVKTVHRPVSDFNRMLTQNGFHYGMMGESLLRMANPVILFIMACSTIMFLSPALGIGALVFSLLFVPVFAKLVSGTKVIAQDFYAGQAAEMGMGVSSAVLELGTQYGGFYPEDDYAERFPQSPFMEKFLTAFDKNILANERMSFAVGLVGALVIFFIIFANGILYTRGAVDAKAMITIIGAFVFLMTSTRTVASHVTNLIRFYPQVKFILEFLDPLKNSYTEESQVHITFPEAIGAIETKLGLKDLHKKPIGFYMGEPVSKFTLQPFLETLSENPSALAHHTQFINASYRFRQNTPLIDLLAPNTRYNNTSIQKAAETLGVWEEFNSLEKKINTIMTETVWNSLTGEARSALRLIPLAIEEKPKIILLDIGVVSNLNPLTFKDVFSLLSEDVVFIVLNDQYCPEDLVDQVIFNSRDGLELLSRDSFLEHPIKLKDQDEFQDDTMALAAIL